MKISQYIITTKKDKHVVLYNSITTALIVISLDAYEQVFCHHNFQEAELVQQLYHNAMQEQVLESEISRHSIVTAI